MGKNFIRYHNYAYRLLGLEKDFTYVGTTDRATYTNLSPGTYTFEIKSTEKTQESHVTRLTFHIKSPWYLSWYAYLTYTIILITILYLSLYAYGKRIELRKEKELSEFKIQKEHELTEKKLEFFTNISHDLKTPLTLIDAPVNDLLQSENLNQEQINSLTLIRRNSKRLYSLLTDLLDFRKLTQNRYKLEAKETNISNLIESIYSAFQEECRNKSIAFDLSVKKELYGYIDTEKIEKIVWNLLSNAVKFTPAGGSIQLKAEEYVTDAVRQIKLVIQDSGIGISEENRGKIFDRFFKVQDAKVRNTQGTGIGLSIVKEMVELHRGTIGVESDSGLGTVFTINIPIDIAAYSGSEIARNKIELPDLISLKEEAPDQEKSTETGSIHKQYNLPTVLLVEDNTELRKYLAGHLRKRYKVFQAEDGNIGLSKAKELNPDIILTDVQMPNLNGYEFCKEIRRNFDTSHIPVVMLTANDTTEQYIEGISTGADAYLTKPFEIKLLDTVLYSLLDNRRKLRMRFSGLETPEKYEKSLSRRDIDFSIQLKLFIENNLMNQDLNVELISEHFAVSLAQLNRKTKSLTGLTPNNLIKSIRLRKAFKLIREEGLRVSEAAYQTGFNDPNYFTTCFRKEFGENPSQIG